MKLTQEQTNIVNSTGDIKINAVAGSGKTTTVIEYAKTKPSNNRILYLAFNKTVKEEAKVKFSEKGLNNVTVETAHSLAYRHVVRQHNYKIRQGYKTFDVAQILHLNMSSSDQPHVIYMIANHVIKFVAYFCNSDKYKIQELDYREIVYDEQALGFVNKYYEYIEQQTRIFLGKMNDGEIEITHDFYLKKFQLSNPVLNFDYILFDEGQDASPTMLAVFLNQKTTKVIVGDKHQQIYGWRHAVNSLEKAAFKTFHLSTSFRFGQEIADLAVCVLQWKDYLGDKEEVEITGKGTNETGTVAGSKAILARTNLGLLLKAIDLVTSDEQPASIYFEGNINSYAYADDGASLYDILNLYNGNRRIIRDPLIKKMAGLEELESYINNTEDVQLNLMVEIVMGYGNQIPGILKEVKSKHVEHKQDAEYIFSTVHRCKGMEYDEIELVNDFISEISLDKMVSEKKANDINHAKLNEEINLLYVAVTRAKHTVRIPKSLVPVDFDMSEHVILIDEDNQIEGFANAILEKPNNEKAYSVEEVRKHHKDAYLPWTVELDDELTELYLQGEAIKVLAAYFGRTKGAIRSRIKKLELDELYGD